MPGGLKSSASIATSLVSVVLDHGLQNMKVVYTTLYIYLSELKVNNAIRSRSLR
jgi:hypothetical protein